MRAALFLVLAGLAAVLPVLVLVVYALAPGWGFPEVLPAQWSLRSLEYLVQAGPELFRQTLSSTAYSLSAVALSLALSLFPARHLARRDFPGKPLLEGLLLVPALTPPMAFSMGVHTVFLRLHLADTFPGVVLALTLFSAPYMLRALIAGFEAMGPDFDRCAANLGAGPLRRLLAVELPLLVPAIVAGGAVVFLVSFSEYFLVYLIGGGSVGSLAGYVFPFLGASNRSLGAALTLLFLVPPLILFALVEGLVGGYYRRRGLSL